jgi:hypothetical protein
MRPNPRLNGSGTELSQGRTAQRGPRRGRRLGAIEGAGKKSRIAAMFPRHSAIKRGAAGEHYKQQVIAANIDTVFVVSGLDADFNPRRIERYLLLVQGSGCTPVVVLTKADKVDDGDAAIAALAISSRRARRSSRSTPRTRQRRRAGAVARARHDGGAGRFVGRRQVDADQHAARRREDEDQRGARKRFAWPATPRRTAR